MLNIFIPPLVVPAVVKSLSFLLFNIIHDHYSNDYPLLEEAKLQLKMLHQ